MKKTIIFTAIITILFTGCLGSGSSKEEWTSLIYPDKNNSKRSKTNGKYQTLQECKEASLIELKNLNLESRGTYQCGLNCKYHEGMKLDICERLSK